MKKGDKDKWIFIAILVAVFFILRVFMPFDKNILLWLLMVILLSITIVILLWINREFMFFDPKKYEKNLREIEHILLIGLGFGILLISLGVLSVVYKSPKIAYALISAGIIIFIIIIFSFFKIKRTNH